MKHLYCRWSFRFSTEFSDVNLSNLFWELKNKKYMRMKTYECAKQSVKLITHRNEYTQTHIKRNYWQTLYSNGFTFWIETFK